ncbi:Bestrophin [Ancylostoma ceylanicum]|uniref:Bestrophin homolog n=1 Tax=Ancylostoma ceylanicum TaxID=53326 RepID=A0A0D6M6T1_9BILA|nr:Bestrophin [Ancylostoma ceylanicum]
MTVSYNSDVSSISGSSFFKLLFRWRGSIWKFVIVELSLWICCYYVVFCLYRYVMDRESQMVFEKIAAHCDKKLDYIPLTFMLGFFVTVVIDRWKNIFNNMGYIENIALTLSTVLRGDAKEVILIRRTIVRYLVLSQILAFRDISMRVRRRFPNLESMVTAGFLHENEKEDLDKINIQPVYKLYWAPVNWALTLCIRAHNDGHLSAAPSLNNCLNRLFPGILTVLVAKKEEDSREIKIFRTNLALLCNFDWVPIPIAYPQVVFLAVRVYFLICLVSRQYIIGATAPNKSVIDLYVPFMTILQFVFFFGWMKTGLSIVDETYDYCPEVKPDRFMDPNYEPVYSEESQKHGHDNALVGSAEGVNPRAHSVQPIRLGSTKPVFDPNPERPYTAFDLSNGFQPSKAFFADSNPLGKVEEEADTSPTDSTATRGNSVKSTIQSIDETEIPEIFEKELGVDRKEKPSSPDTTSQPTRK